MWIRGVFRVVTVEPNDTVLATAKKMLECLTSSVIVTVDNKPRGILTLVVFPLYPLVYIYLF